MSPSLLGALYLCVAMFMAASIDVSVKALTSNFGTPQIVFLRTLLSIPILLAFCAHQRSTRQLVQPRWGWQIYRGLLAAGANFGFFYGLAHMELITAVMLAYIAPVLIVLAAQPLLGEIIGPRRWLGTILGFIGVVVVLNPTNFAVDPAMLAVLGSALCWALLSISNRKLAGQVNAAVLAFYTAPISGLIALFLIGNDWTTPNPQEWGLFFIAGVCGASAHFLTALAYRHAQASTIAPLEYTNLIWVTFAGWFFWQELAGGGVWAGGGLILLGGYIAVRARSA